MPRLAEHETVESLARLDVRDLARASEFPAGGWPEAQATGASWSLAPRAPGLLVEVLAAGGVTGVLITHRGDGSSYGVVLDFEPCHLGGARPWFRCPVTDCDRRCAVLYLRGDVYACRTCLQLRYESQREGVVARAARRRDRILQRLESETGPAAWSFASKPAGMWWRTFDRLRARARQADEKASQLAAQLILASKA